MRLAIPAAATVVVLLSRVWPLAPLQDVATGLPIAHARLGFPPAHLLLTPLAIVADWLTCNSLRQDFVFLGWAAAGWALFRALRPGPKTWPRELKAAGAAGAALALFLLWTVFVPRGASRLELDDPDVLSLDFHSHTAGSWDGRKTFTTAANRSWHQRTGFDAAFITDHNVLTAAVARPEDDYASLSGEEVSLHGAHVLALGADREISPRPYEGLEGLRRFLSESQPVYGALPVMSLPEYWKHHWSRLDELSDWGAKGFEIVSSAPKALDFPAEKRREVVEFCRARNLFMTGGSDNHGYGSAACVWNLMTVPGWRLMENPEVQKAVMGRLGSEGFAAVRVAARARLEPASGALIVLDTPRALWALLRTSSGLQCVLIVVWVWLLVLARHLLK